MGNTYPMPSTVPSTMEVRLVTIIIVVGITITDWALPKALSTSHMLFHLILETTLWNRYHYYCCFTNKGSETWFGLLVLWRVGLFFLDKEVQTPGRFFTWLPHRHSTFSMYSRRVRVWGEGIVRWNRDQRGERCANAGSENRGRGHEPRNVASSRSWKRQGNRFSLELPEGTLSRQPLDFNPLRLILDFWPPEL